jgi:Esterase-like activity of phytase
VQGIVTRLSGRGLAFVMVVGTVAGCAGRAPDVVPSPRSGFRLTLLDAVVMPSVARPPAGRDTWFGSVSGLARDPRTGRYLAVIDDRQPSRVAWLDIAVRDGRLSVVPGEVVPTHPVPGVDARRVEGTDLEAIAPLPDGSWIASEEGHVRITDRGERLPGEWPPALLTLGPDLRVTRVDDWPDRFALGPGSGGLRSNQGFESLTRMPDGRLIAGLEQPLYADLPARLRNGRPFSGGRGGRGRLVELVQISDTWQPRREWVYPLDATRARGLYTGICNDGENGLTDLLALDDTRLLALERACLQRPDTGAVRNTVRIFLVDLRAADDVSPEQQVKAASARPVRKTFLIDFDALIPQLPPELANLDNFEALAFGPTAPSGDRTLLVISDDNFLPTQHTAIVWLSIDETGDRRQEVGGRRQETGTAN